MKDILVGIVLCTLMTANISAVVGATAENPQRTGTGMEPNLAINPSF